MSPALTAAFARAEGRPEYACFTSVAMTGEPRKYFRYRIELPASISRSRPTRFGKFSLRRLSADGRVLRVANCLVPYEPEVLAYLRSRFDVGPLPELGVSDSRDVANATATGSYCNPSSGACETIVEYCDLYPTNSRCQPYDPEFPQSCDPAWQDCGTGGSPGGGPPHDDPCEWCGPEPPEVDTDNGQSPCEDLGNCTIRHYDGEGQVFADIETLMRENDCTEMANVWRGVWTAGNAAWWDETAWSPGYENIALQTGHWHPGQPAEIHMFRGNAAHPRGFQHWAETAAHETLHVLGHFHSSWFYQTVRDCTA